MLDPTVMHCPVPLEGQAPTRSIAELAPRLDRILGATADLIARVPDERIDWAPAAVGAPLRDAGFHVFRLGLAFADGMDLGRVRPEWLREGAPPDLTDGASVARYGALVRGRVSGWFEGAGRGEYDRIIDVAGRPDSGHALLAATVRHAAHHLRQLHAALQDLGVAPLEPLDAADLDAFG